MSGRRPPLSAAGAVLALAGLAVVLAVAISPVDVPFTALMVPLLIGSLLLSPRELPWFVAWMAGLLAASLALQPDLTARVVGAAAIQGLMLLIVLAVARRRLRLGVGGLRGESMFVDLRDRLLDQGRVPSLPPDWCVESALRSAGGTPFAGDFVVSTRRADGTLDVVLVDVSGKGEAAGTRALLLSGAFGGLLGALPADRFLAAANEYLLSLDWPEGFASAVHLTLDPATGDALVRSAGHPPAVHRSAGSGRWTVLPAEGAVLGLIPGEGYAAVPLRLQPGDAVLLYTDGMVEAPGRDLDRGLDRLLGGAEQVVRGHWPGAAPRLVERLGSATDDRALVVVARL
ncbi:serine/threonine-protein phosphatase [Nocardioides sp. TRM66260-LWL]|uniref:PP2C family protein-serine/threonine phosphatase n=1 Tax=Nocardioides sp. TRM66260-LWL TaxID=2874478 RepID=UPI001CC4B9CA|nr:PP2C family protein-serine/threonine phosphatase [Nocardioides sp. TRM66260-LWL]MBZ5733024.1 serine/threonine-protein phosphatase [Nocardioides sp. TRM66260-LWL]